MANFGIINNVFLPQIKLPIPIIFKIIANCLEKKIQFAFLQGCNFVFLVGFYQKNFIILAKKQ